MSTISLDEVDSQANSLLERLTTHIEADLEALLGEGQGVRQKRESRRQFAGYLVSVATHTVGLRASLAPFNSSQEQMVAYVADIFKLKDNHLKRILFGAQEAQEITTKENVGEHIQEVQAMKKRHSWRPELRFRLLAPTFFYDKQTHLDQLSVRLYLFKDVISSNGPDYIHHDELERAESPAGGESAGGSQQTADSANKSKGLARIFKLHKPDQSILIRPVSQMNYLVRFMNYQQSVHKMIYKTAKQMDQSIVDDIYLKIRRHHCEPKPVYYLRLEFWLDLAATSRWNRFKFWLKTCLKSKCGLENRCCSRKRSVLRNGKYFYGFVNIKLSTIPSYAIKRTYPILTLREKRINNCEVCLEFKNRRILHHHQQGGNVATDPSPVSDKKVSSDTPSPPSSKPLVSFEEYIINHLRLYANCALFHIFNLNDDIYFKMEPSFTNISIDNLFYVPSYALINQHRLQSNLNLLEDQSLRRVALMALLLNLDRHNVDAERKGSKLECAKLLLLILAHSEYMVAHRGVDDKILQEADPFREPGQPLDSSRDLVVELEVTVLRKFVDQFMVDRIRKWFIRKSGEHISGTPLERTITLQGLRLCRLVINHLGRNNLVRAKLKHLGPLLKTRISLVLAEVVTRKVRLKMRKLIESDDKRTPRVTRRRSLRAKIAAGESANLWRKLLGDIQLISNDLNSYWFTKGLDSLPMEQLPLDREATTSMLEDDRTLRDLIEVKMKQFLEGK